MRGLTSFVAVVVFIRYKENVREEKQMVSVGTDLRFRKRPPLAALFVWKVLYGWTCELAGTETSVPSFVTQCSTEKLTASFVFLAHLPTAFG